AGTEDAVIKAAIEVGAQAVESHREKTYIYEDAPDHTIWTAFEDLNKVAEEMSKVLGDPRSTSMEWQPQDETPLDADRAATLMKLLAPLDAEDDVQNVYSNEQISDEDMEKLAG